MARRGRDAGDPGAAVRPGRLGPTPSAAYAPPPPPAAPGSGLRAPGSSGLRAAGARRPPGGARGGRHEVRTRLPAGPRPAARTYLRGRRAPGSLGGARALSRRRPAVAARASSWPPPPPPRLLLGGVGGELQRAPGRLQLFFTFSSTAPREGKARKEGKNIKKKCRQG